MKINNDNLFIHIQKQADTVVKDFLSENGIDTKDNEGRTAIINAAFYNNTKLLKWLIENGADINKLDSIGFSALHFACQEGHIESVKILLDNEPNVNLVDNYGNTPAWVTIMNWRGGENFPILKMLYKNGADLTIRNNSGNSAIEIIPQNILDQLK